MIISLIVALGPKNEIGLNNKLLWHISDDLKNFKKITMGKTIVMGRKTFESIGKALPDRNNILLTRSEDLVIAGVSVINDPLMAFDLALDYDDTETSELVIIGGAEIYNEFLPFVQKIYLSEMEYTGSADTFFPELKSSEWRVVESEKFPEFNFKILEKAV